MKRKYSYIFLVLILSLLWFATPVYSQVRLNESSSIGQVSPNFTLPVYIEGMGEPKVHYNSDYLGKWLVLKFWSKYCISCIEGFPVFEKLRRIFSNNAAFLLIGKNDQRYNSGIQKFYNTFRDDWQLKLDVAFDSLTFKSFEINTTPTTVIISPEGKIASIIIGEKLSEEKLRNLFSEDKGTSASNIRALKSTFFKTKRVVDSTSLQPHVSSLSPFNIGDIKALRLNVANALKDGIFETNYIHLGRLYMLGYFGKAGWGPTDLLAGKVWAKPILELRDSALFNYKAGADSGYYKYSISLKDRISPELVMMSIRSDLDTWFDYSAVVETRDMPVMKLIQITESALEKLKTRGGKSSVKGDASGYRLLNITIERFLSILRTFHSSRIIIDGTAVNSQIDLDLNVNMMDMKSLKKALQAKGLDLVESIAPMQVLVIKDIKR